MRRVPASPFRGRKSLSAPVLKKKAFRVPPILTGQDSSYESELADVEEMNDPKTALGEDINRGGWARRVGVHEVNHPYVNQPTQTENPEPHKFTDGTLSTDPPEDNTYKADEKGLIPIHIPGGGYGEGENISFDSGPEFADQDQPGMGTVGRERLHNNDVLYMTLLTPEGRAALGEKTMSSISPLSGGALVGAKIPKKIREPKKGEKVYRRPEEGERVTINSEWPEAEGETGYFESDPENPEGGVINPGNYYAYNEQFDDYRGMPFGEQIDPKTGQEWKNITTPGAGQPSASGRVRPVVHVTPHPPTMGGAVTEEVPPHPQGGAVDSGYISHQSVEGARRFAQRLRDVSGRQLHDDEGRVMGKDEAYEIVDNTSEKAIRRGTELDSHFPTTSHSGSVDGGGGDRIYRTRMTADTDIPDEVWNAPQEFVPVMINNQMEQLSFDQESGTVIGTERVLNNTHQEEYRAGGLTEKGKAPGVKMWVVKSEPNWNRTPRSGDRVEHEDNMEWDGRVIQAPGGDTEYTFIVPDEAPPGGGLIRSRSENLADPKTGHRAYGTVEQRNQRLIGDPPAGEKMWVVKAYVDENEVRHPTENDEVVIPLVEGNDYEGEVRETYHEGAMVGVRRPYSNHTHAFMTEDSVDPKTGKRVYGTLEERNKNLSQTWIVKADPGNVHFSGNKKDSRGRNICFQEGRRITCQNQEQEEEKAPKGGSQGNPRQVAQARDTHKQEQQTTDATIQADQEARHSLRELRYSFQEILDALTELKQYPHQVGPEHVENLTNLVAGMPPEEMDRFIQTMDISPEASSIAEQVTQQILAIMTQGMEGSEEGMSQEGASGQQPIMPDVGRVYRAEGYFILEPVPEDDPRFQEFMGNNYGQPSPDPSGGEPEEGDPRRQRVPASDATSQ